MSGYKRIFLDTAPLIYFLDEDINYAERMEQILQKILEKKRLLLTSAITCTEYLTVPYRTQNTEKADVFFEFLSDCNVQIYSIDVDIAKKAAKIRARYKDFKTMDCLQLATACLVECDLFLTNDRQLRQFDEMKCSTVEEIKIENI